MKHLFIFNPQSLTKKVKKQLIARIRRECEGLEHEIYFSTSAEDADQKARSECESGKPICVYAGGGDGSIHQMAQAIYGYDNACLSVIPVGTGNDFVRNFGGREKFLSLSQIRNGEERVIDLIRADNLICANMLNIGFDASVVPRVNRLRGLPLMKHAIAYTVALIFQLALFPKEKLKIKIGDTERNEQFLLTYIANGQFCGGGYRAASEAKLDDGLMDILSVKPISRLRFLSLVGSYKKGTLLSNPRYKHLYHFDKAETVTLSKDTPFSVCLDGEMYSFTELTIRVLPRALRLRIPRLSD